MTVTVFVLDYQRFLNILNKILPSLFKEDCVSQIIICHGSFEYEKANHERFPRLEQNEIQQFEWNSKQIIRIQDPLNEKYKCYRRWIWIEELYAKNLLLNKVILTHDDDFLFAPGEIKNLYNIWIQRKELYSVGTGRNYTINFQYCMKDIIGTCQIIIGQSMLLSVSSVLDACRKARQMNIPIEILHEDDIVISLLVGNGESSHFGVKTIKKNLPAPNARMNRPDHVENRTKTLQWVLTHLGVDLSKPNCPLHLHSLSTTDDMLLTSLSTEPPPCSQ